MTLGRKGFRVKQLLSYFRTCIIVRLVDMCSGTHRSLGACRYVCIRMRAWRNDKLRKNLARLRPNPRRGKTTIRCSQKVQPNIRVGLDEPLSRKDSPSNRELLFGLLT